MFDLKCLVFPLTFTLKENLFKENKYEMKISNPYLHQAEKYSPPFSSDDCNLLYIRKKKDISLILWY